MKQLTGLNVCRILRNAAFSFPEKIGLVDFEKQTSYTFKEINERVNKAANVLQKLGVGKNSVVCLLMRNCSEFVEIAFAVISLGGIVAPLNYRLSPQEVKKLIAFAEAKTLIFGQEFKSTIDLIRNETNLNNYLLVGEKDPDYPVYEELLFAASPVAETLEPDEHDPCMLVFTSGTTGLPKGFMISHYMCASGVFGLHFLGELNSRDTMLTVVPFYGRVGFTNCLVTFYLRIKNIILNFDPQKVLQAIEQEKVTFSNWVPTMAQIILNYPQLKDHDLSSLRGLIFVGSHLPQPVLQGLWKNICPNISEYYGMQETGGAVYATAEMKRKKPDSCGVCFPNNQYRLIAPDGKDVPRSEIGEIIAKSPSSTASYYKDEAKTKEIFKDGWIHTGDLGRQDEDGFLYIVGRTKDIIVSGGQNVFAPEVEEAIFSHPKVLDCAVIGLPDPKWVEKVTAVVISKPETEITENEIINYCQQKIASFKVPKKIIFTDSLPKTATGKTQKFILVERYGENIAQG